MSDVLTPGLRQQLDAEWEGHWEKLATRAIFAIADHLAAPQPQPVASVPDATAELRFAVGDKVRVKCGWNTGRDGTVHYIESGHVAVEFAPDRCWAYHPDDLERIPPAPAPPAGVKCDMCGVWWPDRFRGRDCPACHALIPDSAPDTSAEHPGDQCSVCGEVGTGGRFVCWEHRVPDEHDDFPTASVAEGGDDARDPLFDAAHDAILRTGQPSVNRVRESLGIGFNHAMRIIEQLAEAGIITPPNANGERAIIVPMQYSPDIPATPGPEQAQAERECPRCAALTAERDRLRAALDSHIAACQGELENRRRYSNIRRTDIFFRAGVIDGLKRARALLAEGDDAAEEV